MQVLPIEDQQKIVEFVDQLSKPKKQTLLEKLNHITIKLSEETLAKLPTDGAENVDHYLYGAPKKSDNIPHSLNSHPRQLF